MRLNFGPSGRAARRLAIFLGLAGGATAALAQAPEAAAVPMADAARVFGAREAIEQVSLSPDGNRFAYIAPYKGQGSVLLVIEPGGEPVPALVASGDPERLQWCHWVSSERLVCQLYGIVKSDKVVAMSRLVAVDLGGRNLKMLKTNTSSDSRGVLNDDGEVIDWLPGDESAVLMARNYLPDDHGGSHLGSTKAGLGVDRIDTATGGARSVEPARDSAQFYISDGHGNVRIMAVRGRNEDDGYFAGRVQYFYRGGSIKGWRPLAIANGPEGAIFRPLAVDPDQNIAYGFKTLNGRKALFKAVLGDDPQPELVLARPDVDVDSLIRIGLNNRVVGASYANEYRRGHYFDPEIEKLVKALQNALPNHPTIDIFDSSRDEQKLLVRVGRDDQPGSFYRYDKATHRLEMLFDSRPELTGRSLATMKPVTYPAADGTMVPGYLTLPPGSDGKNLPAIVLPHGGPAARDEWGFDWLSQFFAARGYAVLQPNYRGSTGYGDAWFKENGFKSWKIAIGDVVDAGRWLKAKGIADPARLSIVGWSYGGYAALQSAIADPSLFKAVVAIAPVTDLGMLKSEYLSYASYRDVVNEIGDAADERAASPARNASAIKVPVMLVHGTRDVNVGYAESKLMADRLTDAHVPHEFLTFDKLDHQLEDSAARAEMLGKIDAFLAANTHTGAGAQ